MQALSLSKVLNLFFLSTMQLHVVRLTVLMYRPLVAASLNVGMFEIYNSRTLSGLHQ